MTPEIAIRHVNESITKSLRHESWIDESILHLTGFATGVMRRLVSNICHLPKANPVYLECGLYAGASFCAALNNNPTLTAIGIEDFSQPFGKAGIREELEANITQYTPGARSVQLISADCFQVDISALPHVDVFYYDGEHSFESQAKALPYFFESLAPVFIFIVDDAHWSSVREGTSKGFDDLRRRVKIHEHWNLDGAKPQDDPIFWNGMAIFVCSKIPLNP